MGEPGQWMREELASQTACWQRAEEIAATAPLPRSGERVAVIGCGTSWFMAHSYAVLREQAGRGVTDAFAASEAPLERDYDAVVAITRSGTTSEVLDAVERVRGRTRVIGVLGDEQSPFATATDALVTLPFADERSVVQTRFATTALTLLRASTGSSVGASIADCERALGAPLPTAAVDAEQITFLGTGWTVGLAHEAALKNREASQSWTESYPAMDYRHGPIAIAAPGRVVWVFGHVPDGLEDDVRATGATLIADDLDPLAQLVLAQRVALERATVRGLDPDVPRNLSRSVILGR